MLGRNGTLPFPIVSNRSLAKYNLEFDFHLVLNFYGPTSDRDWCNSEVGLFKRCCSSIVLAFEGHIDRNWPLYSRNSGKSRIERNAIAGVDRVDGDGDVRARFARVAQSSIGKDSYVFSLVRRSFSSH